MVAKKKAPSWLPNRASSIVTPPKATRSKQRSSRIMNKVAATNPSYELEPVKVLDDESDKSVEPVTPLVATKAKNATPKVTKKLAPKKPQIHQQRN